MRYTLAFVLLLGASLTASAESISVQSAIKFLPREQARNLVRIEAREGDPQPECWYFQVYDSKEETGLHEFAVTDKGITASRSLSQFLDGAKSGDVVGSRLVKVDSDDLIKLVQQYADANKLDVAKINFTLSRDPGPPPASGATLAPLWTLSCFDGTGKKLAELVINARNANIVSHDGFDIAPGQSARAASPSPSPAAAAAAADASPSETTVRHAVAARPAVAVRPAIPVAVAASPTPKPRGGLFGLFHGREKPTPAASPTR